MEYFTLCPSLLHPQVLLQDHQEECPCPDEHLVVELRTMWSGALLGDLGEHPWNDRLVLCQLLGNSAHPVLVYTIALDEESRTGGILFLGTRRTHRGCEGVTLRSYICLDHWFSRTLGVEGQKN